jgi:hypothetical protein
VTANGSRVAVHSLETGKLLDFRPEKGGPAAEALLSTQGNGPKAVGDWSAGLHLVGPKLFICSKKSGPICFNIDRGTTLWVGGVDIQTEPSIQYQEPFIGQDFLILVNRPLPNVNPNANPSPNTIQPHCYSRAVRDPDRGGESGTLSYYPVFRDDSGIIDFQGVEGGFYYLSGDKKLHFVRGGRP